MSPPNAMWAPHMLSAAAGPLVAAGRTPPSESIDDVGFLGISFSDLLVGRGSLSGMNCGDAGYGPVPLLPLAQPLGGGAVGRCHSARQGVGATELLRDPSRSSVRLARQSCCRLPTRIGLAAVPRLLQPRHGFSRCMRPPQITRDCRRRSCCTRQVVGCHRGSQCCRRSCGHRRVANEAWPWGRHKPSRRPPRPAARKGRVDAPIAAGGDPEGVLDPQIDPRPTPGRRLTRDRPPTPSPYRPSMEPRNAMARTACAPHAPMATPFCGPRRPHRLRGEAGWERGEKRGFSCGRDAGLAGRCPPSVLVNGSGPLGIVPLGAGRAIR